MRSSYSKGGHYDGKKSFNWARKKSYQLAQKRSISIGRLPNSLPRRRGRALPTNVLRSPPKCDRREGATPLQLRFGARNGNLRSQFRSRLFWPIWGGISPAIMAIFAVSFARHLPPHPNSPGHFRFPQTDPIGFFRRRIWLEFCQIFQGFWGRFLLTSPVINDFPPLGF